MERINIYLPIYGGGMLMFLDWFGYRQIAPGASLNVYTFIPEFKQSLEGDLNILMRGMYETFRTHFELVESSEIDGTVARAGTIATKNLKLPPSEIFEALEKGLFRGSETAPDWFILNPNGPNFDYSVLVRCGRRPAGKQYEEPPQDFISRLLSDGFVFDPVNDFIFAAAKDFIRSE